MYIKTDRLVIKPYENIDEPEMIELLTNESIKETYMIPDLLSKKEQNAMFQKLLTYTHSSEHLEVGIFRNKKMIGFLNDVENHKPTIEIGYVIHPDCQGQGYATEAFSAVIRSLFKNGYEEVAAGAFEGNEASISVMRKCGMKRMDKTEDITYHNKIRHCVYYHIIKGQKDKME